MKSRPVRTIPSWLWMLVFVIVLVSSDRSFAEMRLVYLDQLFRDADVVVEIQIESATKQEVAGEKCGTKYTGTIVNSYKTSQQVTDPKTIQFGRHSELEIGQRYLAFLSYQGDADAVYQELSGNHVTAEMLARESKESVLELIRCNEIVPGLVVEVDWIVSGPEIIVYPELLVQVPLGVRVDARDGTAYYLRATDVSAYLLDLGKTN